MIDDKYKTLDIHEFDSGQEGPTLTLLGAVHGNEPCGPEALEALLGLLNSGDIRPTKGKLVIIPVCNPLAREQNVRFVERNLNRFLFPKEELKHYEDHLDLVLCPVLEQTDYLLDLHSYNAQGDAFIFLGERNEANISYARALGVPRIIYGWAEAMTANDDVKDKREAMGTTEYAREHGAIGVTLECGNHLNPHGKDVGFNACLNAMRHLEMADFEDDLFVEDVPSAESYDIKMGGVLLKMNEGEFAKPWQNMDAVGKGEVVARYANGEELVMPEDGFLVLPASHAGLKDPWFFWGVAEKL